MTSTTMKSAAACCAALFAVATNADVYTWTGAAKDGNMMTNAANWSTAEGVATNAPGEFDEVVFEDFSSDCWHYSDLNGILHPVYNKLTLRGTKNASLQFWGYAGITVGYSRRGYNTDNSSIHKFGHPLEYVNETLDRTLTITGQDPQAAYSYKVDATNVVNVVNAAATIKWSGHLQCSMRVANSTVIRKTGKGKFIPFTNHNYANLHFVTEHGTTSFATHGNRSWSYSVLEFLGDDPDSTFEFTHSSGMETYGGFPPEYWRQYVFSAVPVETGVTNHLHSFISYNGATLLYTNLNASCTFTGRFRGSLNFTWCPKNDTNTWTFAGGVSDTTGTNWICRGTMALTNDAQFTSLKRLVVENDGAVDVAAGCAIYAKSACVRGEELPAGFHKASALGLEGLTGDGAIVVGDVKTLDFTVPYNAATQTATPVDLTGVTALTPENLSLFTPVNAALSERIACTNGELSVTSRWAMATFAANSGLKVEDFVDASPKYCDLPVTWLEAETKGDVTTLYLVARPVIVSRFIPPNDNLGKSVEYTRYYMMDDTNMWSDAQLPHAGADYYCNVYTWCGHVWVHDTTAEKGKLGPVVFPGESLTLDRCSLYPYSNDFTANVRVYRSTGGNNEFILPYARGRSILRGTLYVDNTCANPWLIYANDGGTASPAQHLWKWTGTHGFAFTQTWSSTDYNSFEAYWDASAASGRVRLSGGTYQQTFKDKPAVTNLIWFKLDVAVTNKFGLGGPMANAGQVGVEFDSWPRLFVNETLDYDVTNRNWYSKDCGLRLVVAEGKTFTLSVPYYCRIAYGNAAGGARPFDDYMTGRCCIEKTGEGTFALASQIIPSDSSLKRLEADGTNNLVRVVAGGVMQKSADAFDGVQFEFHDGARVAVDPAAPFAVKTTLAPTFADGAIVDLVAEGEYLPTSKFALDVLAVPSSTPDLAAHLRAKGYWAGNVFMSPRLSKSDDGSLTTYSVSYRRMGTAVLVR